MCLFRNEIFEGTINLMFSDENIFQLSYCSLVWPLKRALVVAYGVPAYVNYMNLHQNLSFPSNCSSTFLLDQQKGFYMPPDTFCIIHTVVYMKHKSHSNRGREVKDYICISTSMRFGRENAFRLFLR